MSLLIVIVMIAALIASVAATRRRNQRKQWRLIEPDLAEQWHQTLRFVSARPGTQIVVVDYNYQNARSGTKSVVRWHSTGQRQDTWFAGSRWVPGTILVVAPSIGWGPHNQNPSVLYLTPPQILSKVDSRAPVAAASVEDRKRRAELT